MPDPKDIIRLADEFRAALEKQDAQAIKRVVETYQNLYKRLQDKLKILTLEVADLDQISPATVRRMGAYSDLIAQVTHELDGFRGWLGNEMQTVSMASIRGGSSAAEQLVIAAGSRRAVANWQRLPDEAIRRLLGFLDPEGPLYARLGKLSGWTADQVARAIVEGVGMGDNPHTIAKMLTARFQDRMGMALTDALRMTRTVQLYSYREANRASYIANGDVVQGWVWYAHLDGDVCLSCVAEHGSFHENTEVLDDHHNGRCDMLPVVIGGRNPIEQNGEEWFKAQGEATQKQMMGDSKWSAWNDGKFGFGQLSSEHDDEVYGKMRSETPLKDLIGE